MKIITQTKRLYLREFSPDDAIHFYNMNLDEDVIKYTGDNPFSSEAEARTFLSNYNQYELHKMGRWAVCDKNTDAFLGWCGLKKHPKSTIDDTFVEVGYRFYKTHWGKGYATESTKAAIHYGFNVLNLKTIYAHAHIENLASLKVLKKCDLQFIHQDNYDGMPAKLYKIETPNISIKQITPTETYPVRHPVLRVGRPIEDCEFSEDDLETTIHLGLYLDNNLAGVATFLKQDNTLFNTTPQYQLRGMAILKSHQGKRFGEALLKHGETLLKNKNATLLWFNARIVAVSFYKRNGYNIIGYSFEIPTVGTHFVMYKIL
jgi:RimJ/RimL family protein N-acetyltransferase/GNAT superfamily N-acetyltransferase